MFNSVNADLQFLHGKHTAQCTAVVDKVFQGYRTVQYMTQGSVELSYDQASCTLSDPCFWPAYPGPHIRFHLAPGHDWWEHRYIAFRGPLGDRWTASGLYLPGPQAAPRGLAHQAMFDEMLTLSRTLGRWSQLRAINLLESILLELAQARSQSDNDQPLVDRVTQLLNQRGYAMDYAQLAGSLNMGLSTLRRRFAQTAGTSLHAWVLDAKMTAACQWLGETDWPIKTIAQKLGYRDVYFFSRQFAQKIGVPPGAYRTSRQA